MEDKKVLIAEDDTEFLQVLAKTLEREGYTCVGVRDGTSALEQLAGGGFELLICDIQMPGNRNLEVVEAAPKLAPGFPVILLTGEPTVDTAARAVSLPVLAYLVKPPAVDELLRWVKKGILDYRALRAARESRERLNRWERELADLEERLGGKRGTEAADATDLVELTLDRLVVEVLEVRRMARMLARSGGDRSRLTEVNMRMFLRRAVGVLEKTKRNFKSEELRALREDMQRWMASGDGDAPEV